MKLNKLVAGVITAALTLAGVTSLGTSANADTGPSARTFTSASQVKTVCAGTTGLEAHKVYTSPVNGTYVPVVFVHGLMGDQYSFDGKVDLTTTTAEEVNLKEGSLDGGDSSLLKLVSELDGVAPFTFQYKPVNMEWITNKRSGPDLVKALNCLKEQTGQKAIIIAHSMGADATHYALSHGAKNAVSRVITFGGVNAGSDMAELLNQAANEAVSGTVTATLNKIFKGSGAILGAIEFITDCKSEVASSNKACLENQLIINNAINGLHMSALMSLATNSPDMQELVKDWKIPSGIALNTYGGQNNFSIPGTGIFKAKTLSGTQFDFGDLWVAPRSAKAGSSTYQQDTCNYDMVYRLNPDWLKNEKAGLQMHNEGLGEDWAWTGGDWTALSPCYHNNLMRSTELVSSALSDVQFQITKQTETHSTYDKKNAANADAWTIGFDGVGPFKIGETNTQAAATAKTVYGTQSDFEKSGYKSDITTAVNRAYQTDTQQMLDPGFNVQPGRMLVCAPLSQQYGGVRGLLYTPSVSNAQAGNASSYISTADPYNKSTLDQIMITPWQTSADPKIRTAAGAGIGTPLYMLERYYGKQKMKTVDGLKVYQLNNPSNDLGYDASYYHKSEFTSINFFFSSSDDTLDVNNVVAMSVGSLVPQFSGLTYGTCLKKTVYDTNTQPVATYNKSAPNDMSQWTIGFSGIGPISVGKNLPATEKVTGIDESKINQSIKGWAGATNAMNKGQPGIPQNLYGGNTFCVAGTTGGNATLALQTPSAKATGITDYLQKTDAYNTTSIMGVEVGLTPRYGDSNTGTKRFGLPLTPEGLGLASLTDPDLITTEYGSDRIHSTIIDGSGAIFVYRDADTMKKVDKAMNSGGETVYIPDTTVMYFAYEDHQMTAMGVSQYPAQVACEN